MDKKNKIRNEMNLLGAGRKPFVFLIDFLMDSPLIYLINDAEDTLLWQTPNSRNFQVHQTTPILSKWRQTAVTFEDYQKGFDLIQEHIHNGDTYLINYTRPTHISTNLTLEEIFHLSKAPYKILLKDQFVCFSPEPFVEISKGKIYSFPMKGTIEATARNAKELILSDKKELAEHHTIVDLIRNDLSLVANDVKVEKFRYLQRIHTNRTDLWQVSSKISGTLPNNYFKNLGDIIFKMLPAGSVSGAPKPKTIEIILKAEKYERGFYTGIFGYFDGTNLDSCVLIRFIEQQKNQLIFKSGGGITFMSEAKKEYEEMLRKVYVPIG